MSVLTFNNKNQIDWAWQVDTTAIATNECAIKQALLDCHHPLYLAQINGQVGVVQGTVEQGGQAVLAFAQSVYAYCRVPD